MVPGLYDVRWPLKVCSCVCNTWTEALCSSSALPACRQTATTGGVTTASAPPTTRGSPPPPQRSYTPTREEPGPDGFYQLDPQRSISTKHFISCPPDGTSSVLLYAWGPTPRWSVCITRVWSCTRAQQLVTGGRYQSRAL